ncbi:MAG: septum formation protein Maf [Clostridia bacterium]|nr:septum formation protein Maf [Clostridia bacterium]
MRIVLASRSPRRKELLSLLGVDFKVASASVDETIDKRLPVIDEIKRLSYDKAKAVQAQTEKNDLIIAADTVVALGSCVFGKPQDSNEAIKMLKKLSGKTHRVITSVTVLCGDRVDTRAAVTEVTFRELSDIEIEAYIKTGDPFDKAGAYALQGISSIFVSGISGDHFNVYGLPLAILADMLRNFGVRILGEKYA